MTTTSPMSLRLDTDTKSRLAEIATRQKRSSHALAREAVDVFIAEKEREHEWHQSCEAAVEHYSETGLHATHEEVDHWMQSWFTEKELPSPVCHK